MNDFLDYQENISNFLKHEIKPYAQAYDANQSIPRDVFDLLAKEGYLGAIAPRIYGGQALDYVKLGVLHEEFGKVLGSLENILTVYGMVLRPLMKFGTEEQKERWLPGIVQGKILAAIALTEPDAGSDLASIQTQLTEANNQFCLQGKKKYITLGQVADLFLVLAKKENEFVAIFVEKDTPGIHIRPINDMLGLRSNMLAEVYFDDCLVPKSHQLGKIGAGLVQVISCALDEGRYTTACGSVGIAQACLELAQHYAHSRVQASKLLKDHQLIQKMLTEMIVRTKAAQALCRQTGKLRDEKEFSYLSDTMVAKYFSAKTAVFVAKQAMEIFGAAGFSRIFEIERFFRDAQAMEIIEGTAQVHELMIPKMVSF